MDINVLIQGGVNVNGALELLGDMETYNETIQDFLSEIDEKLANIKKYKEEQNKKDVLTGGVFIFLGMASIICALVFMDKVIGALRIILAIYLLYVGIFRLVYAFKAKGDKKPFFINALIIIGVGVLLLLIPGLFDTPLIAIGILLTVYSIAEIVGFVLGRKNGVGATIAEAVVVSEKDEDVKLLK